MLSHNFINVTVQYFIFEVNQYQLTCVIMKESSVTFLGYPSVSTFDLAFEAPPTRPIIEAGFNDRLTFASDVNVLDHPRTHTPVVTWPPVRDRPGMVDRFLRVNICELNLLTRSCLVRRTGSLCGNGIAVTFANDYIDAIVFKLHFDDVSTP